MHQNEDERRHLRNAEGTSDTQEKRGKTQRNQKTGLSYVTADQREITASALNRHNP